MIWLGGDVVKQIAMAAEAWKHKDRPTVGSPVASDSKDVETAMRIAYPA